MPLNKQAVPINFSQGIETKSDPYQIAIGAFRRLHNSIFDVTNRLTKRNGYANITALPVSNQTTLTTLNDNLIATGTDLYAYSKDLEDWLNQGTVQPVQLATQPLVRISSSQESPDAAVSSTGLTCTVYVDDGAAYYQITDNSTGQQIVNRTALPATATNPRVFLLNKYFVITFVTTGTPTLKFIGIPIANPRSPRAATTISASMASATAGYDGYVADNILFIAYGATGTAVKVLYISSALVVSPEATIATATADLMSVTADLSIQRVYVSYWDSVTGDGYTARFNYILGQGMAATRFITNTALSTLTSAAQNGTATIIYQVDNDYTYQDAGGDDIRSDYIGSVVVTPPTSGTGTGTVGTPAVVLRSVGLASKPFISDETIYMMAVYGCIEQDEPLDNSNQSTCFLINSSGDIFMRLAATNAGGYAKSQVLPTVTIADDSFSVPYLVADFLTTVNKGTDLPAGTPVNSIYTQYGVNLATFTINSSNQYSSEIAGALHLTGGQLWEYDSVLPVEHGFHVYPENVVVTTDASGGLITAQTYFYSFTYEWTDNKGMLHRSAPSIPTKIVTTGSTSTNTINVPTLRLTYKTGDNPVRIVGYRWSTAQQVYYQFTSVTDPYLNDTTADSIEIEDTLADSAILGNAILYTTGGVVENTAAPPSVASTLFDNRLWLIDAENRNLLWYSKQVIQNAPVEMSDLLTLYVAPTSGAQGSTGDMYAISAMDDKMLIFKKNAVYYINGNGPDNTGSNSTYSAPVFITSTVGTDNPDSVVMTPIGTMFQSDKGIWLLKRDLSTVYIGDRVEAYNDLRVKSADTIPGTNQVRFVTENNITLMYDYYQNQWATHSNISAISACLYQGMHTYLNSYGQVFQEEAGRYTDGSTPVLMSLTTSWINVAGLQGYERFYFANLLGTYHTPFKLNMQIAYDYNASSSQATLITPDNYSAPWGGEALWGSGGNWGGPGNVFSARFFPTKQKCEAFQVTISEVYDASLGVAPGEGLSLSGLALVVGVKKGYRTQSAKKSFG